MNKTIKQAVSANGLTVRNVPHDLDSNFGLVLPSYVALQVADLMDEMLEKGINEIEYKEETK